MNITVKNSARNDLLPKLDATNSRFIINYGGAGSGKSVAQASIEIIKAWRKPKQRILVLRKFATTLKDSVIPLCKSILEKYNIPYELNKSDKEITLKNASKLIFRGLDDVEKLKSIVDINRCWVEEASQIDRSTSLEINRRLRGVDNIQISYTFNPIDENHWLKQDFFDRQRTDTTIFKTTYLNNKFLTDEDRQQLEDLKEYSPNDYRIYALGEWGKYDNESPFIWAFDEAKHVIESYDMVKNEPVWLSFDFNVDPICCIAGQHNSKQMRIFKEFRLRNSDIYKMCQEIYKYFPNNYIMVTGDASGRNRSAMAKDNTNYYRIISEQLRIPTANFVIPSVNPAISNSRAQVNKVFHSFDIAILKDCRFTVTDIKNVKATNTGDIDKSDGNLTHLLDCVRYYIYSSKIERSV